MLSGTKMQIRPWHDGGTTAVARMEPGWPPSGVGPVVNFFRGYPTGTPDDTAAFVAGHSARRYCRIVIIIAAATDDDDGDGDGDGDDERVAVQPLPGCLLPLVLLRYRAEFIILCRATLRICLGWKSATERERFRVDLVFNSQRGASSS